jgi:hypothetical protein
MFFIEFKKQNTGYIDLFISIIIEYNIKKKVLLPH